MRIGAWLVAAGMALTVAGVASTGASAWKEGDIPRRVPLQVSGADVVDLRDSQIRNLRIGSGQAAELAWRGGMRIKRAGEEGAPKVACATHGRTLRCTSSGDVPWGLELRLPPQFRQVLATNDLTIEAKGGLGDFAVEAGKDVNWSGDAASLEIGPPPGRVARSDVPCQFRGGITFSAGRVGALKLRALDGRIELHDLSRVQSIELVAAGGVGLQVDNLADLQRMGIVPPSATAAAPQTTCKTGAMNVMAAAAAAELAD